jgi:signal peptidase II
LKKSLFIVLSILLIDQVSKIWIKTHLFPGEEIRIFEWFIIHFTENNGMAFGFEFGGSAGKLFLSIFRIVASFGIGWYLFTLIKKNAHPLMITCFSLIFAGAIGNIIDSAFYGMLFTSDDAGLSKFLSSEPGYSGFLLGRVVDMLYFPIINSHYPSWFPFVGGESFQFFRPVFNIADSSITIGVILFIVFQKKFTLVKEDSLKENEQSVISHS